jgi:hypothetical protein
VVVITIKITLKQFLDEVDETLRCRSGPEWDEGAMMNNLMPSGRMETIMSKSKSNQNKNVYVAYRVSYFDVYGVYSSNRALNKVVKPWINEFYSFVRSEKVKASINRGRDSFGDREITLCNNIPHFGLTVKRSEIENSENIKLDSISTVWISFSIYDPGEEHVHLTQEEALAFLKSINCLQSNGDPIEGTILEEHNIES